MVGHVEFIFHKLAVKMVTLNFSLSFESKIAIFVSFEK